MLTTPLGVIFIIVLLVLAAIAAWGAYRDRPGAQPRTQIIEEPPYRTTPPAKKVEPTPIVEQPLPKKDPAPCPCKEEEPCAEERAEINRLKGELETEQAASSTKQGEIDELTGRLANANRNLEDAKKAKPTKPQKVTAGNILPLLDDLSGINFTAAKQLRAEANKPQPEYARVEKRLGVFADYCEQRGFERPDPGTLLQLLQDALKQ